MRVQSLKKKGYGLRSFGWKGEAILFLSLSDSLHLS